MYSKDLQKGLDSLSRRFGIDQRYAQKFFNDYEFAKVESASFGLKITSQLYDQLVDAFKRLRDAPICAETFEKIWSTVPEVSDDKHTNTHQWH